MQLSNAPSKLVEAFAINAAPSGGFGGKRTVPVPSQTGITPGAASLNDGFPPLTMTPIADGGIVMSGLDMNGALFQISAPAWWLNAGAGFPYDSVFSAVVGGYPKGARVLRGTGSGYWLSIADNNTTDPDTGGAGWIPDLAVSSVYASAPQTVNSGTNKVLFDTVEFDSLSQWDATDHRFNAKWPGLYRVSGVLQMPAAPAQNIAVLLEKNGTVARVCSEFPQLSNVDLTFPFSSIIQMAIADYAEIFLTIDSNTTVGSGGTTERGVICQFEYLGNG